MNTDDGRIYDLEFIDSFLPKERAHFIPVERDLTELETLNRQIDLYSPCACGSGKKFKFCCKTDPRTI
jgi:uncharacterized protein YchJ